MSVIRKPRLVVNNPVANFKSWQYKLTERLGMAILKGIKDSSLLSTVDYFTRETLLVHFAEKPGFGGVATITRYTMIRKGVAYLINSGYLVRPNGSKKYLCLADRINVRRAQKILGSGVPPYLQYHERVLRILETHSIGDIIDIMMIVRHWQRFNEVSLTEDSMRNVIRSTLRNMATRGILRRNDDYTYTVLTEFE